MLKKNVTKIPIYASNSLFVNRILQISLKRNVIPVSMLVGASYTFLTVIDIAIINIIAIITVIVKNPADLSPLPNILSKYKTVLNPIVPTSRLAKLANILGIIETSSRSIGLFVKLGNHDQYGTSIIVYVIPHTIYKIDTNTYKLVPVKPKFVNIIIVIIAFN